MELDFSAEDEELRDGVRSVLERECPMTLVRRRTSSSDRSSRFEERNRLRSRGR